MWRKIDTYEKRHYSLSRRRGLSADMVANVWTKINQFVKAIDTLLGFIQTEDFGSSYIPCRYHAKVPICWGEMITQETNFLDLLRPGYSQLMLQINNSDNRNCQSCCIIGYTMACYEIKYKFCFVLNSFSKMLWKPITCPSALNINFKNTPKYEKLWPRIKYVLVLVKKLLVWRAYQTEYILFIEVRYWRVYVMINTQKVYLKDMFR